MKTAVIYCRVSTARQAEEDLPLQSQLSRCCEKAAVLGAEVVRVFQDEGLSARSDHRPAFQAAILYCESLCIDFFITWSTSRFARNRAIVESDHILVEYDPNKLILNRSVRVHSKSNWLPGPALLGTKTLVCALPNRRNV